MKITPINTKTFGYNYKQASTPVSKQNQTGAENVCFTGRYIYNGPKFSLYPNLESSSDNSLPRILSYENISMILSDPDILSSAAYNKIAFIVLKDTRKAQEEAKIYGRKAHDFSVNCSKELKKTNGELFPDYNYDCGVPKIRNVYENPDDKTTKTVYWFDEDGINHHIFDISQNKVDKGYFMMARYRTGKKNVVTFRNDGTLSEIQIGNKPNSDGTCSIDKMYKYDEKGKVLSEYASNIVIYPDGKIEMKNYTRPNQKNEEYLDKFAAKRTINTDGTVDYENVIYYCDKKMIKYFPKRTVQIEDEHKPLSRKDAS